MSSFFVCVIPWQHIKMSNSKERLIKLVTEKLEKLNGTKEKEIEIKETGLAREIELEKLEKLEIESEKLEKLERKTDIEIEKIERKIEKYRTEIEKDKIQ